MPEITPAQITALLLDIQATGKAHATVIKVYTVLHSLFKMAYMGDMIDRNPMDKVERPKPRKGEKRRRLPLRIRRRRSGISLLYWTRSL